MILIIALKIFLSWFTLLNWLLQWLSYKQKVIFYGLNGNPVLGSSTQPLILFPFVDVTSGNIPWHISSVWCTPLLWPSPHCCDTITVWFFSSLTCLWSLMESAAVQQQGRVVRVPHSRRITQEDRQAVHAKVRTCQISCGRLALFWSREDKLAILFFVSKFFFLSINSVVCLTISWFFQKNAEVVYASALFSSTVPFFERFIDYYVLLFLFSFE